MQNNRLFLLLIDYFLNLFWIFFIKRFFSMNRFFWMNKFFSTIQFFSNIRLLTNYRLIMNNQSFRNNRFFLVTQFLDLIFSMKNRNFDDRFCSIYQFTQFNDFFR